MQLGTVHYILQNNSSALDKDNETSTASCDSQQQNESNVNDMDRSSDRNG